MEFQIEGISENWRLFKKDGRGIEYKGNELNTEQRDLFDILNFSL